MMISYFHIVFDALARICPAAVAAMRSRSGRWILALTVASAAVVIPLQASANCTRVSNKVKALDQSGASGGLPAVVNINRSEFQPDGTLMASGIGPFVTLGNGQYTSDEVLFRCDPGDADRLFEFYSTNGDDEFGGREEDGKNFGLPGAYRTRFKGMLLRVTNVKTGRYFMRNWQSRPLTGLD